MSIKRAILFTVLQTVFVVGLAALVVWLLDGDENGKLFDWESMAAVMVGIYMGRVYDEFRKES
jgi:hypothetical protein